MPLKIFLLQCFFVEFPFIFWFPSIKKADNSLNPQYQYQKITQDNDSMGMHESQLKEAQKSPQGHVAL